MAVTRVSALSWFSYPYLRWFLKARLKSISSLLITFASDSAPNWLLALPSTINPTFVHMFSAGLIARWKVIAQAICPCCWCWYFSARCTFPEHWVLPRSSIRCKQRACLFLRLFSLLKKVSYKPWEKTAVCSGNEQRNLSYICPEKKWSKRQGQKFFKCPEKKHAKPTPCFKISIDTHTIEGKH